MAVNPSNAYWPSLCVNTNPRPPHLPLLLVASYHETRRVQASPILMGKFIWNSLDKPRFWPAEGPLFPSPVFFAYFYVLCLFQWKQERQRHPEDDSKRAIAKWQPHYSKSPLLI